MILTNFLNNILSSLLFTLLSLQAAFAQISPPGLGEAKTASWFAVGMRQDLNSNKSWQSMTYVGLGRKSNPTNENPTFKPAILVLNQEFYHPFSKSWQTSFALSYRRQHEYEEESSYLPANPAIQQEFRLYGRMSKSFHVQRFSVTPTFRQEIRRFYRPDFKNSDEPLQLRSRFRVQVSTNLDQKKKHKVMVSSEQLFTTSQTNHTPTWSKFAYKESRFMLYYSYSPVSLPVTLDIGYMNNLIGKGNPNSVHYIAFDIIVKNPFGMKKQ